MPFDRYFRGVEQANCPRYTTLTNDVTVENPVPIAIRFEVFLTDPSPRFVTMTAFGPPPQGMKDLAIYAVERFFADNMSMVVSPAFNHRIELGDEMTG